MKMGFWKSLGKPFSTGAGGGKRLSLKLLSSTLLFSGSGVTDWVGRPHLAVNGNTWVLAYRVGATHSAGADDRIHLRFSRDEGATWTNEDVFTDSEPCVGTPFAAHDSDGTAEGMVIPCPNGNLLMHVREEPDNGGWQYRSIDGGKTWTDEGQLNISACAQQYTVVGTDIYVTTWGSVYSDFYKSTNNGTSWSKVSRISAQSKEAGIVHLGGNTILAVMRDGLDTAHTWTRTSTDLGTTWGAEVDIFSQVGAIHKPMLKKIGNRVYLSGRLFVNATIQYTVMYVSSNGGQTWVGPAHTPQFADTGYSDFLERTNGNIYLLSYGGSGADASIYQYIFK